MRAGRAANPAIEAPPPAVAEPVLETTALVRTRAVLRGWRTVAAVLCILVMVAGIGLRVDRFLDHASLWHDEVLLCLNIVDRSYAELLLPLDDQQEAPVGFLVLQRAMVDLFGDDERALRLVPLAAGCAMLPLFWLVGRRILGRTAIVVGLALLAFGEPLIRYSVEAKPYALDAFLALLVVGTGLWAARGGVGRRIVLALVGAMALWFSYPVAFALLGVAAALAARQLAAGRWRDLGAVGLIVATWAASAVALYLLVVRDRLGNTVLVDYWSRFFMPLPPTSMEDLRWYPRMLLGAFADPVGLELRGLGALAFLFGIAALAGRARLMLAMCLATCGAVLLASGFGLYPFQGRLILFLVPLLALLVAAGVGAIVRVRGGSWRVVGAMMGALLLLHPVADSIAMAPSGPLGQELRPVLGELAERHREGDAIYVYWGAEPAFRYYSRRFDLGGEGVVRGSVSLRDWETYQRELESLAGASRVWVVFSHVWREAGADEERLLVFMLDDLGQRLDEVRAHGASAYLYDLNAPSFAHGEAGKADS